MGLIYQSIINKVSSGKKMFAWLVDPDSYTSESLKSRLIIARDATVDLILVGGSLVIKNRLDEIIRQIKSEVEIPVVIFPGNSMQINDKANAILFLSLISGRNPDYIIGRHVETAFMLKKSGLEIIPTGYIIIDTGFPTSVSYMSNTTPIPKNKAEIAISTAIAGELLGQKLIFLEGGSGANTPVYENIIRAVKSNIDIPLIVGGGITKLNHLESVMAAGADIIVVGNGIEKEAGLIKEFSEYIHSF